MPHLTFALGSMERLLGEQPDPWRFAPTDGERAKFEATLNALPPSRLESGLEIGCRGGLFTRHLAASCDTLLAVDLSREAIQRAERYCEDLPWVQFAAMDVRTTWPEGSFDLILFSETLGLFDVDGISTVSANSLASLAPDGAVVLVNRIGPSLIGTTGDEAAEHFIAASRPRLVPVLQRRVGQFRIDALK